MMMELLVKYFESTSVSVRWRCGQYEGESLVLIIVWFSGKYKTHIFKLSFPEHEGATELVEPAEQTDDITINLTATAIDWY